MAGDWIKMRSNLWDDPRVARLVDLTESSEAAVVGALYWLWAAADQHSADGVMPGLTLRAIDRRTGVTGFGAAMAAIGWLIDHPDGVRVARFDEHNGDSAKRRLVDAKRKAGGRGASGKERTNSGQESENSGQNSELEKEREKELTPTTPDGVVVASGAGATPPCRPLKAGRPDCPHQQIVALYHEILPECPQVRDWTPARAQQLRARWNEDPRRQTLDYWRQFFTYVKGCGFLVGRSSGGNGRPFLADLEWLTRSQNFTKVREGKYE
jgi:hypothetical protein